MTRIAVLGMGRMGQAAALRLLDAGHEVFVWNRTLGRTADVFGNPQHVYTQMLLDSVPHLHEKWSNGIEPADVPDELPDTELVELEPGHLVRRAS